MSLEAANWDGDTAPQVTSPRSVEAFEATGILPEELLRRNIAWFQEKAKLAKGIERSNQFIERRHAHYEQKRLQKIEIVKRKRQEFIQNEKERAAEANDAANQLSSVVLNERKNVEKQRERQKKELQNLLAYELRRQQIEEENNKNMQIAFEREEKQRKEARLREKRWEEHQRRTMEEKMQKQLEAEERARIRAEEIAIENERQERAQEDKERRARIELQERNAARMQKRREQREAVERKNLEIQRQIVLKRMEMERQEEERQRKIEEARLIAAAEHKAVLEKKKAKFLATQVANARILEEKKEAFLEREKMAEERMEVFEQEREREHEENRQRALAKAEHLRAVKAKAEMLLEEEVQRALIRERAVNERLAQRERDQIEAAERQKEIDAQKQAARLASVERGKVLEQKRVEAIEKKRYQDDLRREVAVREAHEKLLMKQAQEKLLVEDRKEHALRMKRIQEYEKRKLMMRITDDEERVADMKSQKEVIKEQRRRMRDMGVQQRTMIMDKFDAIKNSINLEDLGKGGSGDSLPGIGNESGVCEIDLRKYGLDVDMKLTINLSALSQKAEVPRLGKKKKKVSSPHHSLATTSVRPLQTPALSRPKTSAATLPLPAKKSAKRSPKAKPKPKPKPKKPKPKPREAFVEEIVEPKSEPAKQEAANASDDSDSDSEAIKLDRTRRRQTNKQKRSKMDKSASSKSIAPMKQRRNKLGTSRSMSGLRKNKLSATYGASSMGRRSRRNKGGRRRRQLPTMSRVDAEQMCESLAAEQNGYLLMLLERERANENERERIYEKAKDHEKVKLDHIFGMERAKASQIIKQISREHEDALSAKMEELGLLG